MRNRLIHPDETWKDYIVDTIQIVAMLVVIGVVLYSLDMFLDYMK